MNKNKNGKRKNRNVDANIITSVKDQTLKRSCSSSYAFATVAALESLYLLENLGKPQIELSEQ
jgi:C1A family cysteine protease